MSLLRTTILLCLSFLISLNNCGEIEEHIQQLRNEFRVRFHEAFEARRIKEKYDRNLLWRFSSKEPFVQQNRVTFLSPSKSFEETRAATWTPISDAYTDYLFTASDTGVNTFTKFDARSGQMFIMWKKESETHSKAIPIKSLYFRYYQETFVAVLYRLPKVTNLNVHEEHELIIYHIFGKPHSSLRIKADGKADFDLVQNKGNVYLALSTTQRVLRLSTAYESKIQLFLWKRVQFDEMASYRSECELNSVKIFVISSVVFIATSESGRITESGMENGVSIYSYNNRKNFESIKLKKFIRTNYTSKIEHFRVNRNNYLILLGSTDAQLIWWSGGDFLPYRKVKNTANARDVSVMMLPYKEVILCFLFQQSVRFYSQISQVEFIETYSKRFTSDELNGVQINSIQLRSFQQKYFFAFFTFTPITPPNFEVRQPRFSPIWKLNLIQSDEIEDQNPLTKCIVDLHQLLSARDDYLVDKAKTVDTIWVKNRRQKISAPVIVTGTLRSQRNSAIEAFQILSKSERLSKVTNSLVHDLTERVNASATLVRNKLKNVVLKNMPYQVIDGTLNLEFGVDVQYGKITTVMNQNVVLNRIPFMDIKTKLLTLTGNQVIPSFWTFKNNLWIERLNIVTLLNKINLNNLLLLNGGAQTVTGNLTFHDLTVSSDINLFDGGRLNAIQINELAVVRKPQAITGRKHFRFVRSPDVYVNRLTNDVDFLRLISKSVKLHSKEPQIIQGKLVFDASLTQIQDLHTYLINERVNITHISLFAVSKTREQEMVSPIFFCPMQVETLNMHGLFNGLNIRRDLLTTNTVQNIYGNYTFNSEVIFRNHLNTNFINRINLNEQAIRSHSPSPQKIMAHKVFTEPVCVTGNVVMNRKSTIDDVDPSELPDYIHGVTDSTFDGRTEFNELVITGKVVSRTGINNFIINDLPRKIWLKSQVQVVPGRLEFRGPVNVGKIVSKHVNGFRFPVDFVEMNSPLPQIVMAKKYFTEAIVRKEFQTINGIRLNGVRLQQFSRYLFHNEISNGRKDIIKGEKIFKTLHVTGNLFARQVNSMNIEKDVLLTRGVQSLNGDIVFRAPQLISEALKVDGNLNVDTINGVKLSDWTKNVVLQSDVTLKTIKNKIFANKVVVNSLNAKGTISGIDFDGLRRNVVTKNTAQIIKVPLKFTGSVHFATLNSGFVNKLNFKEFLQKVVLRNYHSKISGVKIIKGDLLIKGNLRVNGPVNEVNLNDLFLNTAMKSAKNVFHSHVVFANNVIMKKLNVSQSATINGISLNDLVLLNDDFGIEGKVVINSDARIDGTVNVTSGFLSGCDVNKLLRSVVWLNGSEEIDGNKIMNLLSVRGDVFTRDKKLSGIDFSNFQNLLVDIKSQNERLIAPVIFRDSVKVDNLILRNSVNDVDINLILVDAVSKSMPQTILGYKKMNENMVVNSYFEIRAPVKVKGTVNGVNVLHLNNTSLRKHGIQEVTGVKVFGSKSTVTIENMISKTINGIRVPDDVVIASRGGDIHQETVFRTPLDIRGNLVVMGPLDSKNLTEWLKNRLTLSRNEKFPANLEFKDKLIIDNLFVNRWINDIQVHYLLYKSVNHSLKGHLLEGNVFANNISLGGKALVNNLNIPELMMKRVDLQKDQFIAGTTVFKDKVQIGIQGMQLTGPLNAKNLSTLQLKFQTVSRTIKDKLISIEKETKKQSAHLSRQIVSAFKQSPTLDYFEIWREFPTSDIDEIFDGLQFERVLVSLLNADRNSYHTPIADAIYFWQKRTSSRNKNCFSYSTIVYKIEKDGDMQQQQGIIPNGRVFPPTYFKNDVASTFFLKTSQKCSQSESDRSITFVTNFNVNKPGDHSALQLHHSNHSTFLTDVKYFKIHQKRYAITSYAFDLLNVNVFDENQKRWVIVQRLPTSGAVSLDVVTMHGKLNKTEIYLAIANRLSKQGRPIPSQVLKWNQFIQQFQLFELIDTWSAREVIFIPIRNELYLAFANEKATLYGGKFDTDESIVLGSTVHNSFYTQPVSVYRLMGQSFTYIQSINFYGANTFDRFYLSSDAYLAIGSSLFGETRLYKHKGVNNFQEIQRILTPGVSSIRSYWSQDGDLFLAIASLKAGHTKLLKAMITGVSPLKLHTASFNTKV